MDLHVNTERSKTFMRLIDIEHMKRRSQEYAIELRKNKRTRDIDKRRFKISEAGWDIHTPTVLYNQIYRAEMLLKDLTNHQGPELEKAVETVRLMLTSEPVVSADLLVSLGYLEKMIGFMQPGNYSKHMVVRPI